MIFSRGCLLFLCLRFQMYTVISPMFWPNVTRLEAVSYRRIEQYCGRKYPHYFYFWLLKNQSILLPLLPNSIQFPADFYKLFFCLFGFFFTIFKAFREVTNLSTSNSLTLLLASPSSVTISDTWALHLFHPLQALFAPLLEIQNHWCSGECSGWGGLLEERATVSGVRWHQERARKAKPPKQISCWRPCKL